MRRTEARHAGPRGHRSWWRGPVLPLALIAVGTALLVWELSWAVPLLEGM